MSARVHSSLMGPRYTVSQRSSWPTLRCVAFSPYYRQDDPRTAGAMDTYFREAFQAYADVTYKDLHDYLGRLFHAWYAKFKPASSAVVSAGDPELGEVVPVDDAVDGAAPTAKRTLFSMTLKKVSAAPAAPAPPLAGAPTASDEEGASEGGSDADQASSPTLTLVSLPDQGWA